MLSLREAILIANDDTGATSFGGFSSTDTFDTITFHPSLNGQVIRLNRLTASQDARGEDGSLFGDLDITSGVRILGNVDGAGNPLTIIDGNGTDRVFSIGDLGGSDGGEDEFEEGGSAGGSDGGIDVVLENLIIQNGVAIAAEFEEEGEPPPGHDGIGGGILNIDANLTIVNAIIRNNTVLGIEGFGANGGGLYNDGGHVEIYSSLITGNTAGALFEEGGFTEIEIFGSGGGIYTESFFGFIDGGGFDEGGFETLLIFDSEISNNTATGSGGGIFNNQDHVEIYDSEITGNQALGGDGGGIATIGGVFETTLLIYGSTISGNSTGGSGGGVFSHFGHVELHDSAVSGNTAENDGGGIFSRGQHNYSGTLFLNHSTVSENDAGGNGGGIFAEQGQVLLLESTVSGNTATSGGGLLLAGTRAALLDSEISGNTAHGGISSFSFYEGGYYEEGYGYHPRELVTVNEAIDANGGGISSKYSLLRIQGSTISGNTAQGATSEEFDDVAGDAHGGGIHFQGGHLSILQSTVSGNQAIGGSSVDGLSSAGSAQGGGLFLSGESGYWSGFIGESTFSSNSTIGGSVEESDGVGDGGGIWNNTRLEIFNSTISGNTATRSGGGVYSYTFYRQFDVDFSTITGNRADSDGNGSGSGGGLNVSYNEGDFGYGHYSAPRLRSTIVAGNERGAPEAATPDDIQGNLGFSLHNLIGDPNSAGGLVHGVFGNILGQEDTVTGGGARELIPITEVLNPLANNGGPTQTHALVEGSPAINNGSGSFDEGVFLTDQRGLGRGDGAPDIGAYEVGAVFAEFDETNDLVIMVTIRDLNDPENHDDDEIFTVTLTGYAEVIVLFEGTEEGDANDDGEPGNSLDEIQTIVASIEADGSSNGIEIEIEGEEGFVGTGVIEETFDTQTGRLDLPPFAGSGVATATYLLDNLGFDIEGDGFGDFVFPAVPLQLAGTVSFKPFGLGDTLSLVFEEGQTSIPLLRRVFVPDGGEGHFEDVASGFEILGLMVTPVPALDFGDAPDNSGGFFGGEEGFFDFLEGGGFGDDVEGTGFGFYDTTRNSNGARHVIVDGSPILGTAIDAEEDGQPTAGADGDDFNPLDAADDEDGVTFTSTLIAGREATVDVFVSLLGAATGGEGVTVGYLNAWIDFDGDGSWYEFEEFFNGDFFESFNPERIFVNQPVVLGNNSLTFTVDIDARALNLTYVRFRITSQPLGEEYYEGWYGLALDGEVEDYTVSINTPPRDYGDAPAPYPTVHGAFADPAFHTIVDGIQLGAAIDAETDGQDSANADGDDNNPTGGPDDEDGVVFSVTTLTFGQTLDIDVTATAPGFLNAWIDWGGDGFWDGVWTGFGEDQIVHNLEFFPEDFDGGEGTILPSFTRRVSVVVVPFGLFNGEDFFARFRFSTEPNLTPFGGASDGEVEDYKLSIISFDFGDAPDTYGTDLTETDGEGVGPSHRRRELTLGFGSDAENDGQPSLTANGDDDNGPFDDENGVFFGSVIQGTTGQVSVWVVDSDTFGNGTGYVNAWFDFDGDGVFEEGAERIFTNQLVTGFQTLTFTVPAELGPNPGGLLEGEEFITFARFRLTTQPSTVAGFENAGTPHGLAPDGEVEDYGLIVSQPFLPDDVEDDGTFVFVNVIPGRRRFDPAIAIGYDYTVSGGDGDGRITTIELPSLAVGDNLYTLHLPDGSGGFLDDAYAVLAAGVEYDLTVNFTDAEGNLVEGIAGGLTSLRILGIEAGNNLDPENQTAFETVLTITDINDEGGAGGPYVLAMDPIPETVYVDNVADFTIVGGFAGDYQVTTDQGVIGTLDAGDIVTWFGSPGAGDDVTGLKFGFSAFAVIQNAINFVEGRDISDLTIIQIGPGTFRELLTISGTTLVGAGDGSAEGEPSTTIDGDLNDDDNTTAEGRVITISIGATVSITGVVITGGNLEGGGQGAGIFNSGTLTILDSTITGNRATGNGGGIFTSGPLTITNSTISDNTANYSGGGIYGNSDGDVDITISNSTITGNFANNDNNGSGNGGGIAVFGNTLTITNSTIRENRAADGGGIYAHTDNEGDSTPDVTIDSSTISGNTAADDGGGIYSIHSDVLIINSTISENTADSTNTGMGGGIYSDGSYIDIISSTISGNTAGFGGGAVFNHDSNTAILNSTVSGNLAGRWGGGLFNFAYQGNATLTVINSTITGNRADFDGGDGGDGGGIYGFEGDEGDVSITLHNSIVAGNLKGPEGADVPQDIFGVSVDPSSSFNIIGARESAGGLVHGVNDNIVGVNGDEDSVLDINLILDVNLKNNGGPTQTHRLVFGSPAIDSGSNGIASDNDLDLDQRGNPRIVNDVVDRGAYERGPTLVDTYFAVTKINVLIDLDGPGENDDPVAVTLYPEGTVEVAREYNGEFVGDAADTDGDGLEQIAIEIVSLSLRGFDPLVGEAYDVTLVGGRPIQGEAEEQANNTVVILDVAPHIAGNVNSYFDLLFEVDFEEGGPEVFNENAIRVVASHNHIVLPVGVTHTSNLGSPEDLVDDEGSPTGSSVLLLNLMLTPQYDFGDAPDDEGEYPTLLSNNGARHVFHPDGPRLGTGLDPDIDGMPTTDADGDDQLDASDDEDGVQFGGYDEGFVAGPVVAGTDLGVRVNVDLGNSASAVLDGWIDLNQDGDWLDEGEHVINAVTVNANGPHDFSVALPSSQAAGDYYSRFRISTAGQGGLPTGAAADGEVEDHLVTIVRYADLDITKTDDDGGNPIIAGAGSVTYTVKVTNNGPSDASGVVVTDTLTLPAGATLTSFTASGMTTFVSATGIWTIGNLASGASATLTLIVTAGASVAHGATISNTATITGRNESDPPGGGDTDSDTASTTVNRVVDIEVEKTVSTDTVIIAPNGGPVMFTFTVTVTNNGPSDASGVEIDDVIDLPDGVSVSDVTFDEGTNFDEGDWSIGDLASGASRTLTIEVAVEGTTADLSVITNTAFLDSVNEADSNSDNNEDTAQATVQAVRFVTAEVDEDGNLVITDFAGEDNNIKITFDKKRKEYVITSTSDDLSEDGTEGTNEVRIPASELTGGIIVDLGDGDDKLDLSKISIAATVNGGDGDDTILGGKRNDELDGGDGDDSLNGGSGNDTITGGDGQDKIAGGSGTDTLKEFTDAEEVVISAKAILGLGNSVVESESIGSSIERIWLVGGDGNNRLDASSSTRSVLLDGGDGADTLNGGKKNDTLFGGDGEDFLKGNEGNDTILGGDSDDVILGGTGNDVIDGGGGKDAINGESGNDKINGGDGGDTIFGDTGNDTILGGDGDDELHGDSGKDSILGEGGDDTIDGGNSKDRLDGGGNGIDASDDDDLSVNPAKEIIDGLMFNFDRLVEDFLV